MAEILNRDPACPEACCPGQFGAPIPHGITLSARTNLTLIDLRGNPQHAEFLASAQAALRCALPLKPNPAMCGPDCDVLWLGPDEWLLVGSDAAKINSELLITSGFLTDVSHGRAALRINGPRTLDLLAKGCGLDLHPRVFQPGQCAQTSLAHIGVLIHRAQTGDGFDLYYARSYAQHLWHWLTEAADEFGYEVIAPTDM